MKAKAKVEPQMRLDDMLVGLADAQRLIGKGETHILMLVRTGRLKKVRRGLYRVADVAQAALQHRESEDRKSFQTEEARRMRTAKAREVELRIAKELGELIHVEDVKMFFTDTLGVLRSELTGLPAACSREPEARAVIERELDVRIARCSRGFAGAAERIEARRPLIAEDGDSED